MLAGHAIATHDAAARRVWYCVSYLVGKLGRTCRLAVLICASHQSIRVVMVAICGGRVAHPTKQHSICCNGRRLFRHLLIDYVDEFALGCWRCRAGPLELARLAGADPAATRQVW